jgi:putative nucleotidyltransferase with HDIG domain
MQMSLRIYFGLVLTAAGIFLLVVDWGALGQLTFNDYAGLAVFIGLATLSEHLAVESGRGRRVRSSIAFLPLLAAALIFPVGAVVLAVATMYLRALLQTKNWSVFAFNLAQSTLAYGTAAVVFRALTHEGAFGGGASQFPLVFLPFYVAATCYFFLNVLFITAFIAIRDEQPLKKVVADATGRGAGNIVYDLIVSPGALLVAYLYSAYYILGLIAVVLPLLLVRYTYLSTIQLERANHDLLKVFVKAIETRDPYTSGHSQRVSTLAQIIAEDIGLRHGLVEKVTTAALLHDIGKIDAAYANIILKDSSLTPGEIEVIQTHAVRGSDLLESLSSLDRDIILGVRHHHERYDGTGYPDGLAGKAIPIAARIIMICDAVDAMLSDRPYRNALSIDAVRSELLKCSGTQFDPDIVAEVAKKDTLQRAERLVGKGETRPSPKAVAI